MAELPLRVLLVLSEPAGAGPTLSHIARSELLHGLRSLDQAGAVIVDQLRPPTFEMLVEAVTTGEYHLLVFYGHGGYDEESGGGLLFEDESGDKAWVAADELGAVLRNTDVRMVLLGACESAQVSDNAGGEVNVWSGTAPALLRAGVPLAIGMQVITRVDAAQAFIRQFALSLSAGKTLIEAVGEARLPLIRGKGKQWFVPALYGRPRGEYRLFDPQGEPPAETADLRAAMQGKRDELNRLEVAVDRQGVAHTLHEIAALRAARAEFAELRQKLAGRTPGRYAPVVSPLYGVPSNPIFVGRQEELVNVCQELDGDHPVTIWGVGGIGKSALAIEVAHRQSWRFPAGVLWLDCRGGPAFDTLLERIGAFCGIEGVGQI